MVPAGLVLSAALLLLAAQPAAARTIYVTPEGGGPGYGADGRVVAPHTSAFSTEAVRGLQPGDVVQLLADSPATDAVTRYRRRVVLTGPGGRDVPPILVRGLGPRTRMVGRTIDEIRGCPMPEDDIEQPCGDLRTALAAPPPIAPPSPDLLGALTVAAADPAGERTEDRDRSRRSRLAVPIGHAGRLADAACLDIDRADGITVEDLAFEGCWLAAVRATGSRRVTLRRSLIIGSSYGLAARGSPERPSDTLVVEDVTWVQDASGYDEAALTREGPFRCRDGRVSALGCAGVIWRSIPWGATHHGAYDHFNGALLGGADVRGPIVFRRNTVLSAYNGVRLKAAACEELKASALSAASCPFNQDVWITDNLFAYVRDNPVELETWATDVRVARNRIVNSHAWFSFDDMGGGPVYVYGNRGWFDDVPAIDRPGRDTSLPPCSRQPVEKPAAAGAFDPKLDRRFDYARSRWLPVGVESVGRSGAVTWMDPGEQSCEASLQGRVIKVALPPLGAAPDSYRYAERGPIYVFNNSWYLRSPVTGIGAAANLRHWNNALLFCEPGADADLCRTRPETFDASACGRGLVRGDDLARYPGETGTLPFFDCFRWLPVDERGHERPDLASEFDHDVSSTGFPLVLMRQHGIEPHGRKGHPGFTAPERGDFRLLPGALAASAACAVTETLDHRLDCSTMPNGRAFAGAFDPENRLYDGPASARFRLPE
ncbi:hypothetical protein [Methylobacterium nonmethylotrophicum]|uniref:hypothetical protein n=1 Tax=Methylobacterium nonmethylotrophicum TaxID=1141884 RepID=UPI001FE191DB|nr:hypothetical protein [Methylobacterium nonmethylotrophicum]